MPVEIASPTRTEHGAAPTWDTASGTVLRVDVPAGRIHRFHPDSGREDIVELPQQVGAAKPRSIGGLVCNLADGVALLDPDGTRRWLAYWSRTGVRCADAAVDPMGRLWAGSAGQPDGWLAVVEPDGAARVAVADVAAPAGISWSADDKLMYLLDGRNGRLDVFDFDAEAGAVARRRPVARFAGASGLPSSACVDADGCVWVAIDGAGEVRRYTPAGAVDRTIGVPAPRVTGCAFGGRQLTDLYLTTAVGQQPGEYCGALLVVRDAGTGVPAAAFAG